MIGRVHRLLRFLVLLALAVTGALLLYALGKSRPQDLPWTPFDLSQPIGLFTGQKLAGLTDDRAQCHALLKRAGVQYSAVPDRPGEQCGYVDAVRLRPNAQQIGYRPADVAPSCPVVAALKLWEWDVVQPAALEYFGQGVRAIEHFGSYNCRRLYGRETGPFSEHATADAIDIAGFILEDGTRIRVLQDWKGGGAGAAFLHAVRDGACDLFSTTLSPDYNRAHADHLHFDQAERGALGASVCR